jgi:transcriptional regulator with XRE-family HTH domain
MNTHEKQVKNMQKNAQPLAELRDHWNALECPPITKIAKKANVTSATANRYLTGIAKFGTPKIIRALAIAMDRPDIAKSVEDVDPSEDYIAELRKQWSETTQQQLAEQAAKHKQEMGDLANDHRLEREEWNAHRNGLINEIAELRTSFDKTIKIQHREKWISFALFIAAVALLIVK